MLGVYLEKKCCVNFNVVMRHVIMWYKEKKQKENIKQKEKKRERERPLITTITYNMENFFYIYIKEDSWLCILIIIIVGTQSICPLWGIFTLGQGLDLVTCKT